MALLASILWIVVGILYISYKFGEEFFGNKAYGLGCIFVVVAFFALLSTLIEFSSDLTAFLLYAALIGFIAFSLIGRRKQHKVNEVIKNEKFEISIIRNDLPMPTQTQMMQFINDIENEQHPSDQQCVYQEMLRNERHAMMTVPLDAKHFKDMQAAWIYYSKNDSKSPERKRIFGCQDISSKTFFDPSIDRSGERQMIWCIDVFTNLLKQIPTKISSSWCNQPIFCRKVSRMVEDRIPLTEATLYPLMVESYGYSDHSSDLSLHWMKEELSSVWITLVPQVLHVLSKTSMSRKQEDEWLKVESFRIAVLPAVQEKRILENADAFEIMICIYDTLVSTEFSNNPHKYNFTLLWYGLDSVGKAVGNSASFFDYPKYIRMQR